MVMSEVYMVAQKQVKCPVCMGIMMVEANKDHTVKCRGCGVNMVIRA